MKSTDATQASSWKLKSVKGGGIGVDLYPSTINAKAGWIQFIPSHTISLVTTVKLPSYTNISKVLSALHVLQLKFANFTPTSMYLVTSISLAFILSLWYAVRTTNISQCIFLHPPITVLHHIPTVSSTLFPQISYNHVCPWQANTLPTHIK